MAPNRPHRKGRITPNMEGNAAYKALSKKPRNKNLFKIPGPTEYEKKNLCDKP